jgi:CubicO group peptidase (beta-lactamase class C family)
MAGLFRAAIAALLLSQAPAASAAAPDAEAVDATVRRAMARTGARGLAIAIIDDGQPVLVRAWGERNAAGDPLTTETVMYGASLTKSVFAYTVMQLVEEGRLDLDRSIADYLPRPLPEYDDAGDDYAEWQHLAGDERWRRLTPRILLSHRSGFHNFGFMEPDRRLRFHFDPGDRYSYSGEGFILLQSCSSGASAWTSAPRCSGACSIDSAWPARA